MHAFLLALLVTGVAAFGSLPAAHPGNPCLDPNDFLATNSIVRPPYCAVPNAISETKDTCEAAGCYWDEYPDPGSDSCGCGSQQLCESDAVGGTWTVNSFTCGDEGLLNQGWNCASNPGELGWFSGGCCSGGAAASKCNAVCEIADCAFNPCKDPNDFDPAASKPDDHCVGDEPPNPIAASREACVAVGCEWNEGNPNDPCHCNSQQLCESPAVGGTWTARSLTCGGSQVQGGGPSWACDAEDAWLIDHFAGVCCRGGTASSKCNCEALDCAFNPCMDPNDFDPMAAVPHANCTATPRTATPSRHPRKRARLLPANGNPRVTSRATAVPSSSASLQPSAALGTRGRTSAGVAIPRGLALPCHARPTKERASWPITRPCAAEAARRPPNAREAPLVATLRRRRFGAGPNPKEKDLQRPCTKTRTRR